MIDFIAYLPVFIAPVVLMFFSLISAYVFKFGISKSGICSDYIIFSVVMIVALILGGAL